MSPVPSAGSWPDVKFTSKTGISMCFSSRYTDGMSGILQKPLAAAVHMSWIGPLAVSLRKNPIQKSKRKTCGAPRAVCPLNSAQIAGLMCRQSLSIVPTAA